MLFEELAEGRFGPGAHMADDLGRGHGADAGAADKVAPMDELIEEKGVRVLIDPKAVLFLLGTEMDYKADKLSAQFVFNNPNQTSACGCGESVQLKPAAEGH